MPLPIFGNDGRPLHATCSIGGQSDEWDIVIESRGGIIGTPTERNSGYSYGFEIIVQRLASIGATLLTATVDSNELIRRGITESDRRLNAEGLVYPITLRPESADQVASALRRAQAAVGSQRSRSGGNTTRRVRFTVRIPIDAQLPVPLADFITGAKALGSISDSDLSEAVREGVEPSLDPSSLADARERVLATILRRQGQPRFRAELLRVYARRCAITGCDAESVLEAAHIIPYRGAHTNTASNGLLLRADVHTLFDRGLLGVDPTTWTVVLHPSIRQTDYGQLEGVLITLPTLLKERPHPVALQDHLDAAGLVVAFAGGPDNLLRASGN